MRIRGMIDDRLESTGKGILLISAIPLSSNRCQRNELPSVSSIMTMFGTQRWQTRARGSFNYTSAIYL